MPLSCDKCGC